MSKKLEANRVKVTGQIDRPLIPANESCERYILLTIEVPEAPRHKNDRLPLNLSLVIDRSGSMSGDKLAYVKEAALHTLRLLAETDRVSVVIYDDEVEVIAPSTTFTPKKRKKLLKRVRQIRTGGMTNLSGGWFTGCDQIADYMTADYLNRALLLTDGLANRGLTDQEKLVYQAKELRRRGIMTTTFGVGADFNQFLLQGIADGGGGHFYFIDRPRQIPDYFQGELGEMLATVAREMTLEITVPKGVDLELLNDVPRDRSEGKIRLLLGDAYAGEMRTLVLKAKLPACSLQQYLLLPITLSYEDALARCGVTVEGQPVQFMAVKAKIAKTQPVDETVMREAGRLETEKAKMEALQKEYQGDIVGAQTVLRRAGVALSKTVSPAVAQGLLAELEEMNVSLAAGLTAQDSKKRHYATYLKHHSRKDY